VQHPVYKIRGTVLRICGWLRIASVLELSINIYYITGITDRTRGIDTRNALAEILETDLKVSLTLNLTRKQHDHDYNCNKKNRKFVVYFTHSGQSYDATS